MKNENQLTLNVAPRFKNRVPAYRFDLLAMRVMSTGRPKTLMLFWSMKPWIVCTVHRGEMLTSRRKYSFHKYLEFGFSV